MIYFDNSDTTPIHPDVLQAMLPYFTDNFANPSSLHNLGLAAQSAVEQARQTIAQCVGAKSKDIVFTSGATESNNLAIFGTAMARPDRKHLIISSIEHPSIMKVAERLEKHGYRITRLPVDKHGNINFNHLSEAVTDDTFLVSIAHANQDIGVVQNIRTLAQIAHGHGAWMHTDASQSLGKIPCNVRELDADLVTFNSHKLHGPKGVGALYAKRYFKPKAIFEGSGQEFGLRPGTPNVPAIVGFAKAVSIAVDELVEVSLFLRLLGELLAEGLLKIPRTKLNGPDYKERLPGNISMTFKDIEGEALMIHLANREIYVAAGTSCGAAEGVKSNSLKAIGLDKKSADSTVRFSVSRFNTQEEVEQVIYHTDEIVDMLRAMTLIVPKD